MKILKILFIGFTVFILCCSSKDESKYIFGVAVPFTGQEGAGIYGENSKKAIDLAVEEINSRGGVRGKKLEPRYEDDQLLPNVAVAAVTKLISVDKVKIIIGNIASSSTMASANVVDRNKVILISPGSTSHELSGISPYVFRTIAPDNFEGEAMAKFVLGKGYKKFGIVFVDNAGTRGPAIIFQKKIEEAGGQILASEVVPQGTTDVRTQMTKIVSTKPDAVYLLGYALELGTMIKQFREQDQVTQILSFQVFEEQKVLEIAGNACEGVIYTTPTITEEDAIDKEKSFITSFKAKYGVLPGIFAANAYDAVYVFANAIEKVGFDIEEIRKELTHIRGFNGASGVFDINDQGDSNQPPQIKVCRSGKLVRYQ